MSDIAETYLVVSLLMAVFAAVAAMGTALVLGIGFERLRGGFEVVRKQTAYFSDAIRKLDDHTQSLDRRTGALESHVAVIDQKTATLEEHQNLLAQELRENAANHIHAQRRDAAAARSAVMAEDVLAMAGRMKSRQKEIMEKVEHAKSANNNRSFVVPASMMHHVVGGHDGQIRFH